MLTTKIIDCRHHQTIILIHQKIYCIFRHKYTFCTKNKPKTRDDKKSVNQSIPPKWGVNKIIQKNTIQYPWYIRQSKNGTHLPGPKLWITRATW